MSPVHLVSARSNDYRFYVLRDDGQSLLFTQRRWGEPVSTDWIIPELVAGEPSSSRPDPDFAGSYLPGLLVAKPAACRAVAFAKLELVPVLVEAEERALLNPRISLRRFRAEGADVMRTPNGAVLVMRKADFHAADVPAEPACFWFHDGRATRFLLCNEGFRARVEEAGLSGLAFRPLGRAF